MSKLGHSVRPLLAPLLLTSEAPGAPLTGLPSGVALPPDDALPSGLALPPALTPALPAGVAPSLPPAQSPALPPGDDLYSAMEGLSPSAEALQSDDDLLPRMERLTMACQPRHLAMLAWALGEQPRSQAALVLQDLKEERSLRDAGPAAVAEGASSVHLVHMALTSVARAAARTCTAHDMATVAWALAQQVGGTLVWVGCRWGGTLAWVGCKWAESRPAVLFPGLQSFWFFLLKF